MILSLSVMFGLAQQCAPAVAPETLLSVARVESGFDPWVVAANGSPRRVYHPASAAAAAALAGTLIGAGRNIDVGVGQINSRNLSVLGLSLADAFDPCRNLAASARVLQAGYVRAMAAAGDEQLGLRSAFSLYNTGDAGRGFRNGYVARVTRAAAQLVPALRPDDGAATDPTKAKPPAPAAAPRQPPTRGLDVFARTPTPGFAIF